ncbi:DUF6686 family protein [Agriterribacter sp.]|uniref:DUF6686 family protein n=1 Tax=Agriterribacter sp. TaxID=2821509 RepID=UPI002C71AB0F|nr:DUF6686 family protein [Agriterribacter sp.]HRO48439.1 hypothetical protein [Agriterribacter sp.]HRQ19520.1 hypothetical protein [Agriterribacter sp.]
MCGFQYLYNGEDGYVVRCKQCGHYQLAFASVMLTLTENEFRLFGELVKYKCEGADDALTEYSKSVVLRTPAEGVFILLTKNEAVRLCEILEEADNENKALTLMSMFNS